MVSRAEAVREAAYNYMAQQYPDFDNYAAVVPFMEGLLTALQRAELAWFLKRVEADEMSHD